MRLPLCTLTLATLVAASAEVGVSQDYGKTAVASGGMVAAAHPKAVDAGLEMLRNGGNAADAAAAVAFALAVVEPFGSSIGGDGVSLVYMKEGNKLTSYTYRCQAPALASYTMYDYSDKDSWVKSTKGPAIPGMVKGTLAMQEEFGVLTREQIMAPAIRFARDGFPVEKTLASVISDMYDDISGNEATGSIFLDDLFPPEVGATLQNPDLADSLTLIAEQGESVFYEGELAKTISTYLIANGGHLTYDDFKSYEATRTEAIHIDYKGYQIYSVPPPFGGIAVLGSLQLYERVDISNFPNSHSLQNVHALAETMKLAIKDRYEVSGDPRFVDVPVDWILSEEYADVRIKSFHPERANVPDDLEAGPVYEKPDPVGSTTHLTVVDGDGNAVCITQTLGSFFGSCVTVPGTGIVLNDQMKNFSSSKTSPNNLQPGKQMHSTQAPTMVLKDGELILAVGSPGNYRILTTIFQVIVYYLDFDLELQEAINAPRIAGRNYDDELHLEARFSDGIRQGLIELGHELDIRGAMDLYFGGVHAVARDPETGMLTGGADPRRDGVSGGLEKPTSEK